MDCMKRRKTAVERCSCTCDGEGPRACGKAISDIESYMEDNMLIEILVRLPVKSLGRFKCVSKKWNLLISCDPFFRKQYTARVGGSPRMLGMFHSNQFWLTLPYQFGFLPSSSGQWIELTKKCPWFRDFCKFHFDVHVIGSACRGHLLCSLQHPSSKTLDYFIINPINKLWFSVPKPTNTGFSKVSTAFTCNESFSHYKVVRAIWPHENPEDDDSDPDSDHPYEYVFDTTLPIEILDQKQQQWEELKLTCSSSFILNHHKPGIISEKSGFIYWQLLLCSAVLVFDPNRRHHSLELEMIQFPEEDCHHCCFGQINGLIVYVQHTRGDYGLHDINMWMLDEHKRIWSPMEYSVKISNRHLYCIKAFHPLDCRLLLVELSNRDIVWFNLETKPWNLFTMKRMISLRDYFLTYVLVG